MRFCVELNTKGNDSADKKKRTNGKKGQKG